jgi:hypothetical protein
MEPRAVHSMKVKRLTARGPWVITISPQAGPARVTGAETAAHAP